MNENVLAPYDSLVTFLSGDSSVNAKYIRLKPSSASVSATPLSVCFIFSMSVLLLTWIQIFLVSSIKSIPLTLFLPNLWLIFSSWYPKIVFNSNNTKSSIKRFASKCPILLLSLIYEHISDIFWVIYWVRSTCESPIRQLGLNIWLF